MSTKLLSCCPECMGGEDNFILLQSTTLPLDITISNYMKEYSLDEKCPEITFAVGPF